MKESRELLGRELAALVSESYERAYLDVVRAEQLAELEEVVAYSQALSLSNGEPCPSCLPPLFRSAPASAFPIDRKRKAELLSNGRREGEKKS